MESTTKSTPKHAAFIAGVPGISDVQLINCSVESLKDNDRPCRVTFIADCSASMGSTYTDILVPSMKRYYDEVKPFSCTVILFGQNTSKYEINEPSDFRPVESKSLEGATNIEKGIIDGVNDALEYLEKRDDKHYVQVFVFLSDGGHNTSPQQQLEKSIEECGKKVKLSELYNLFLVVGIGGSSNTTSGMKAKMAIQTIDLAQHPIHYAKTHNDLSETMKLLMEEQQEALGGKIINISCTPSTKESGLMLSFVSGVASKITMLTCTPRVLCLYKGEPPSTLSLEVDGILTAVQLEKREYADSGDVISIVHKTIQDVAILGVTQENTELVKSYVTLLDSVVGEIKTNQYVENVKTAQERIKMMRSLKGGIIELQQNLNKLKDQLNFIRVASNEDKANFLRDVSTMKFGSRALRRAVHSSSKDMFNNTKDRYKEKHVFTEDELKHDRISILSTEPESEHYNAIWEWTQTVNDLDVLEMLFGYGAVGYLMRVFRSNSSDIDAWSLKVKYISSDLGDTASVVCAMQAEYQIHDLVKKEPCSDVLVVINPKNPIPGNLFVKGSLFYTYNSLLFTRTLDLALPRDQRNSLLMHSLLCVINQYFADENLRTLKHITIATDIIYTLYRVCQLYTDWWKERNDNLLQKNPAMFLTQTERDNIQSLAQIIALLITKPQSFVTDENQKHQWFTIKLSMIKEHVARKMRQYIKRNNLETNLYTELRKFLGITNESCKEPKPIDEEEPTYQETDHSDSYDEVALTQAVKLFKCASYISKSLRFVEFWQKHYFSKLGLDIKALETISDDETEKLHIHLRTKIVKSIEKKNFDFAENLPPLVKAAIVLQGLMNPTAKDRKEGLPSIDTEEEALVEIKKLARKLRRNYYTEKLSNKIKVLAEREAEKHKKAREEAANLGQEEFLKIHQGNAEAYTQQEIDEMNKSRPLGDQLSLTRSNMLRHHCGYPKCAFYLKSLATVDDIKNDTNNGLWNHLAGFIFPKNVIISGFHASCKRVFYQNTSISKQAFVDKMIKEEFAFQIKSKNRDVAEVEADIIDAWELYNRWIKEGKSEFVASLYARHY